MKFNSILNSISEDPQMAQRSTKIGFPSVKPRLRAKNRNIQKLLNITPHYYSLIVKKFTKGRKFPRARSTKPMRGRRTETDRFRLTAQGTTQYIPVRSSNHTRYRGGLRPMKIYAS